MKHWQRISAGMMIGWGVLIASAHATPEPGPYFGGDLHYVYLNKFNKSMTNNRVLNVQSMSMQIDQGAIQSARNMRKGGAGIGFIVGYLFNENFALENAYFVSKSAIWTDNNYQRMHHRVHGFDIDGKAIWNFSETLSANLRFGLTHVNSFIQPGSSFTVSGVNIKGALLNEGRSYMTPNYGVGLSFEFDHNQCLELFFRQIQKHKEIGTIPMAGINFTYNFGEKLE